MPVHYPKESILGPMIIFVLADNSASHARLERYAPPRWSEGEPIWRLSGGGQCDIPAISANAVGRSTVVKRRFPKVHSSTWFEYMMVYMTR